MATESDEELWHQARHGQHSAFGAIFERHVQAVYNHCFRRVGNWATAEDLTSVVFLEAWRAQDRVHFVNASLRPWLLGVATNVCRNGSRALRRYKSALSRLPPPNVSTEPQFDDGVVDQLASEAQMQAVLTELDHLHEDDRVIIELSVWDGLSYDEISAALGIPVGTVRSRLSRARARLRAKTSLAVPFEEEDR